MKRINFCIILLAFILPTISNAQENLQGKTKELYISVDLLSFNNLNLEFKSALKNNWFYRISATNLNVSSNDNDRALPSVYDQKTTSVNGGLDIGIEKRKQLNEKLWLFYGINIFESTSFSRTNTADPTLPKDLRNQDNLLIGTGLGFDSGFILNIVGNFSVSAEISPRLSYSHNSHTFINNSEKYKDTIQTYGFGISSSIIRISLLFSWTKK